jgi:acyl-CoA synthetase (AMP-forming)/AMP-acid ligase II
VTAGLFISDGARREVYFEKPRDNLKTRFGIPSWSAFIELEKDIIIRGGENVSPREVEEVLLQMPQILDAEVIGIPDKVYGEEIKAFCVVKKDATVNSKEIIAFCREKLPKCVSEMIPILNPMPSSEILTLQNNRRATGY